MTIPPAEHVQVTRWFDASAERVFDAWLDPTTAGAFLFATPAGQMVQVDIDARVGGPFCFVERREGEDVAHVGTYLEIDRPRRLAFRFAVPRYGGGTTRVTVEVVARGAGCDLTLTHEGVHAEYARRTESGWHGILDGLEAVVSRPSLSRPDTDSHAGDRHSDDDDGVAVDPGEANDPLTCGAGLAAHATLPASIGDLLAAMADVLDQHQDALDLSDADARPEHHAYVTLVLELRAASTQLVATAQRMTGYRDLPMGRHDEDRMSSAPARAAFERFLHAERALLSLLGDAVGDHDRLLESLG